MSSENRLDEGTREFSVLSKGSTFHQYRVEKKLGAGGMGEVYLAQDMKLGRPVAIKFLALAMCAEQSFKERFLREARSAAKLSHPNIITIHEVSEYQDRPFIAMEYIKGRPLTSVIRDDSPELFAAVGIVVQVAQALQVAHENGIVHRDIKPDNIIVGENGQAKVLDFGLALENGESHLTRPGTALGTAGYMSPEQARGEPVDHHGDIFALGVVLYEMLTGLSPFLRDNLPASLHAVIYEDARPAHEVSPEVPVSLSSIIHKAISKSPASRYQSAADFCDSLLEFCGISEAAHAIRPLTRSSVATKPEVKGLAVLLLRNLGNDSDDYLSYGITEDLIVDLTRIGGLRVTPMRSVMKYKDSDDELEAIAGSLKVRYILDGSIHKSESSVRISALLIDTANGDNLWADRWNESSDNLPRIKEALADGVGKALGVESAALEASAGEAYAKVNVQAYELYLRGKYAFGQKRSTSDVEVALGMYRKALENEPSLIEARAGIAEIMMHKAEYASAARELDSAIDDARQRGLRAVEAMLLMLLAKSRIGQSRWDDVNVLIDKALELSRSVGDLAGEVEQLGVLIHALTRRAKYGEALQLFKRVIEINRKLDDQQKAAEALKNMGTVYLRMGSYERARELYAEAIAIARNQKDSSLEADCIGNTGLTFFHSGQYAEAFDYYNRALAIHTQLGKVSTMALWHNNIAMVHESRGDYRRALESLNEVAKLESSSDRARRALAFGNSATMHAVLGEYDDAMRLGEEALAAAKDLDYPLLEASAADTLGSVFFALEQYEESEARYLAAINCARNNDLKLNNAISHANLGELYFFQERWHDCTEAATEALRIASAINQREAYLKASAYLRSILSDSTGFPAAKQTLYQILGESEDLGDPRYITLASRLLGKLLLEFGTDADDRKTAIEILEGGFAMAAEKEIAVEKKLISKLLEIQ